MKLLRFEVIKKGKKSSFHFPREKICISSINSKYLSLT